MNKTNNWKEIEEEFHKQFDSKTYDFYQGWTFDEIDEILSFFKPYFQEKRHTEALEELEIGIYCTQCDNNKPRVPGGILMLCEKCFKKLQGK